MSKEAARITGVVPNSLEELIHPLTRERFFNEYYGKSFIHVPGPPGKFANIFPWSQLNQVLEYQRLSPVRLRIFKDGEPISPRSYMYINDAGGARLRILDLTRHLAAGATLILDDADELCEPLRALAAMLERIFRVRVQANVYAGWRTTRGFDLHWDDHDVFILQVAGSKCWMLHEPTRLHPVKPDAEEAPAPSGPPAWESILKDGDFLYIPRGWWHVAIPLDEPCLHVTISIKSQTGLDLLHWFVNSLKSSAEVRKDVPHLSSVEEQAIYMERLTSELFASWNADVMRRFLAEADEQAAPRLYAQLPHSASVKGAILDPATRVKLAVPRRLQLIDDEAQGVIRFKCYGKQWEFDRSWLPFFQLLNEDGSSHALKELMLATTNDADSIEGFARELIRSGLLLTEPCA